LFNNIKIFISDTTLRDGEQTYGFVFSNPEKITIAKLLCEIGIHELEVGFPSQPGFEYEYLVDLVLLKKKYNWQTRLIGWHRPVVSEIKASVKIGLDGASSSIPITNKIIKNVLKSSYSEVLTKQREAIEFLVNSGLYAISDFQDAFLAEKSYLFEMIQMCQEVGANRIRLCDTVGRTTPFKIYDLVNEIANKFEIDIEIHAHNDLGLAVANCIAGIMALKDSQNNTNSKSIRNIFLSTTVNGIGERTGNTDLFTLYAALNIGYNLNLNIDTSHFHLISEYVSIASNRPVPVNAPVVGENNWRHSSGIHVDGILKDTSSYELIPPIYVGLPESVRKIGIGKHSGKHALIHNLNRLGVNINDSEAFKIIEGLRKLIIIKKRMLTDTEIINFVLKKDY